MLKINHLYHTTPERAEDSPFRIKGFHTLFYSQSLLCKEDLYEIEKWIQIPFLSSFISKDVFFFQKIKGIDYLIILRITRLPDARDTFGRKDGVYQCHGIICPPEVWQKLPSPLSLLTLVESHLFPDRETALASQLVNRATGEISPLETSSDALSELNDKNSTQRLTAFEAKVALLVRRLAIGGFTEGRLLLHGEHLRIFSLINKICQYIPAEFWPQLSFDPVLDGLQLHPLPVRIAGYYENPPKGGNPIIIDLKQESIDGEVNAILARPLDLFEHWLLHKASYSLSNLLEIRSMMAASDFLAKRRALPFSGQLPINSAFIELIRGTIDKQFVDICNETFGAITKRLMPFCSFQERFSAVMIGFSLEQLEELKKVLVLEAYVEPDDTISVKKSNGFLKRLTSALFKKNGD